MNILCKATFLLENETGTMILYPPNHAVERQVILMPMYDTQREWDDPFERVDERRGVLRFRTNLRIMIAVESGSARRNLVGAGIVHDMSEGGLYCVTKHQLRIGHDLTIRFSTEMCPPEMCLPKSFYGNAKVVRTAPDEDDRMFAAVAFGDDFMHNMEFSMFVRHLETTALTR